MDTLRRLSPLALALGLVTLAHLAFADDGAATQAGMPPMNTYSMLVMVGCAAVLWAMRNYTHDEAWTHTAWWGLVSSLLTGAATGLPPAISAKGLNAATVQSVVYGVLVAALAQSKPVGRASNGGGSTNLLLPFLLLGAVGASGCATGADGLRQACTATSTVLTGAYQTTARLYHARKEELKAKITPDGALAIKAQWDQAHDLVDKVLKALDTATDTKNTVCALIPAVEAGQRKDVAALEAQLTQVGADVLAVLADVQKWSAQLRRWRVVWRLPSPGRRSATRWA